MNIGFVEARQMSSDEAFDCFVFHDVDLLPENDLNSYACPSHGYAHQLVSLVDIYNYKYGGKKYEKKNTI